MRFYSIGILYFSLTPLFTTTPGLGKIVKFSDMYQKSPYLVDKQSPKLNYLFYLFKS